VLFPDGSFAPQAQGFDLVARHMMGRYFSMVIPRSARLAPLVLIAAFSAGAGLTGCGGGRNADSSLPSPATRLPQASPPAVVDSLWEETQYAVRHGKWKDAIKRLERLLVELRPGDPRIAKAHYFKGEALFARGERLEAAREFRKAADDTPNDPIAPDALLRTADVFADMWRRPELDPSYGQTAVTTYQELLTRYPDTPAAKRAEARIAELNEWFALKAYKAAVYYYRLKAYDSAILYLKDLVANYPRASIAPEALIKLVQAYRKLGYREDVQETCGYMRRFHAGARGINEVCPPAPETADAS
jgi:outer membrane assembly lipoprotein YfiO